MPSSFDQSVARILIGAQGVRLTARTIQREHVLGAEPLTQRMFTHQPLKLARSARPPDRAAAARRSDPRAPPAAAPPAAAHRCRRPVLVHELRQRVAAPGRQCLAQHRLGALRIARRQPANAQCDHPFSKRTVSTASGGMSNTYPGRRVTITPGPSNLRNCEMYTCSAVTADVGAFPAHNRSASSSDETTRPTSSAKSASSARCFGAAIRTCSPLCRTSSGPSNPTSRLALIRTRNHRAPLSPSQAMTANRWRPR